MAILKCKMCGGDILLSEDKTTGTCDHCGSTMTFPRVSDEQKLNLYNRANHFRRQNEFDKAITAYERILEQDDADAEAHWGAVLSRYGIEYVEDPVTHERIPTCHRVQPTSILTDEDYLAAIEHAPDTASRDLYEQEARRIADIQKGILAISSQEKPYDVFICYKETDDTGRRTRDSALAQDIYYQLTNEGYKVFFSRITLEDKLGQQYEPYIFAALNSAKVMLVVGTKPEYFNAVWVKNEWSRYLALMKNDRSRLLIPCYRDMDPYDLPEELSALQSQDMSKIGFVQDLIRGIKKVLDSKKPEAAKPQTVVQQAAPAAASVENLMKRVRLFMEDGDFRSADEYLDRVLDEDAEYAPAYVTKVCTALGFRREADLGEATFLYADHPDWKKALRFATPEQRAAYEGYYQQVKARVDRQIRDYAYDCAMEMAVNPKADREKLNQELEQYQASCAAYGAGRADGSRRRNAPENEAAFQRAVKENEPGGVTEQRYQTAADMFRAVEDGEATACADKCLILAEQARKKVIYQQAADRSIQSLSAREYEAIATQFLTVADYKNAREKADLCRARAEAIRKDLYDTAVKIMNEAKNESYKWGEALGKLNHSDINDYRDIPTLRRNAEQHYQQCVEAEKEAQRQAKVQIERMAAKKKRRKIFLILLIVLAIAGYFASTKYFIPKSHYEKGIRLRTEQKWEEAIEEFTAAGNYSDAETQILETIYQQAMSLEKTDDWEKSSTIFASISYYKDAYDRAFKPYYDLGQEKLGIQDWDGAVKAFTQAGDYSDAKTQILVTYYTEGEAKRELQDWDGAAAAFEMACIYSDAATQIQETRYLQAASLNDAGKYAEAYAIYAKLSGYKNVDSIVKTDDHIAAAALEAKLETYKMIGNFVVFGHYPQTISGTDNTPIEWLVLDYDSANNRSLLISRYGLDAKLYNDKEVDITWEKCTLRKWLNGTFYNKAFNTKEQSAIQLTNVNNSKIQGYSGYSTNGGNNTQDKIFLLSYAEAYKYFGVTEDGSTDIKARVAPTAYAINNGAWTHNSYKTETNEAAGWWWLRSPGRSQAAVARVYSDGSLDGLAGGLPLQVRPAFWLNLESSFF